MGRLKGVVVTAPMFSHSHTFSLLCLVPRVRRLGIDAQRHLQGVCARKGVLHALPHELKRPRLALLGSLQHDLIVNLQQKLPPELFQLLAILDLDQGPKNLQLSVIFLSNVGDPWTACFRGRGN